MLLGLSWEEKWDEKDAPIVQLLLWLILAVPEVCGGTGWTLSHHCPQIRGFANAQSKKQHSNAVQVTRSCVKQGDHDHKWPVRHNLSSFNSDYPAAHPVSPAAEIS